MNRTPRLLLALALTCFSSTLLAGAEEDQLRANLLAAMPGVKLGAITKLPYVALYEVVINGTNVFYTDAKGEFGLFGNLVELKSRTNLTEQRRSELSVVDFSRLPLDKAIVKVKGNGSRKLAVFTDPDCPYCKKLEQELSGVTDVTVYVFLFPLPELHPDAPRKAKAIWCAPDRAKAWDDLMLSAKEPAGETASGCSTPIEEIARLARELNINGTPGLIFGSGKLVPGAIPAKDIEKFLGEPGKS
jgi:thiol:disulfide interchange protein DsbC